MKPYDHKTIEKKWQADWQQNKMFATRDKVVDKDNLYILVEFPYPSGNLHVGHWYAFAVPDIYVRAKRMQGHNVLFPIGFDAFGLPAENAALKRNIHPRDWTLGNIAHMKKQLESIGSSFDWSREVVTCDPKYYKWTQWLFLQFFKNGLAYQAETEVNWCPSCKTVLANEQVIAGKCERCEHEVEQKLMKQWQLRIADYAEKLLAGLERLDWPEEIKQAQRHWIGKSPGINITYKVKGLDEPIVCFTTRPDTNFGATFIVLAPESQFVTDNIERFPNKNEIKNYLAKTIKKTELERISEGRKKTGVFTGLYAINNLNQRGMPIYLADFVLAKVGTGAVVGVPGHDKRDFEFAQAFGLEVKRVVVAPDGDASEITKIEQVQEAEGTMVNSEFLNGLEIYLAKKKIMDYLVDQGWGERVVNYRMRDWVVSRQRYWGCPIPVIHCKECGAVPIPIEQLPVKLPDLADFKPRDDGKSPLAKASDWVKTKCPVCGGQAERETDTLDTFVDSSWYFLRYTDPQNTQEFASQAEMKKWLPVDFYSGGAEHTTMHLLYSRFWIKAMFDLGLVDFDEPYVVRMNRGLIMGPDGQKMSKSRGNVVDPDEYVEKLGADTVRLYLAFIGPYNETGSYPWDLQGIQGMRKFLERVYRLVGESPRLNQSAMGQAASRKVRESEQNSQSSADELSATKLAHKTIKKVTEDIENLKFNTAIAQLMIYVSELSKITDEKPRFTSCRLLVTLLAPFAPHLAEELWSMLGADSSVFSQPWPQYDEKLAKENEIELVIQINGKVRGRLKVAANIGENEAKELAINSDKIKQHLAGQIPEKIVFVAGRLVNIVLEGRN